MKGFLHIPIKGTKLDLNSAEGKPVAEEYNRIVEGGRGQWVEFKPGQIKPPLVIMPEDTWRIDNPDCYYVLQTIVGTNIKVYNQLRKVMYADYIIGYDYISPWDLYNNGKRIIDY